MIKTKTFDLIDYSNNLSDISDNFWHDKLETDIIHFITREKEVPKDNLRIIIFWCFFFSSNKMNNVCF